MNYLKSSLGVVLDAKNLNEQISYYLYSQILVRSGGLILNDLGQLHFNPFLNVDRNSKVVVYSSGSFGQHILSTNAKINFFEIVKWIDVDYHDMKIGNNIVQPISSINNSEFDKVIIATINATNFKIIKEELGLVGIDENKIAEINTDKEEIDKLLTYIGFDSDFKYVLDCYDNV